MVLKPRVTFSGCADVCVFPSTPNNVTWHYNVKFGVSDRANDVGGPCRVLVNPTKANVGFVSWTNRLHEFFWRYLAQKRTKKTVNANSHVHLIYVAMPSWHFQVSCKDGIFLRSIQTENVVVKGKVTSKTMVQWWFAKYNVHLPCLCFSPA